MKQIEKFPLGLKGEQIAYNYLSKIEYVLLERNWRFKHKEIDLIMMDGDELVIVEVKTRSSTYFERPQDAVNLKKQRLLIQAANAYVEQKDFSGTIRFDVVSIICNGQITDVEHIQDAFYPMV
ncbi:MAG: YraN family protein [Bacteroidales bacterium]|jgi:putative endonuclease|nr:YraN family protein [Bacteroidales bacterium]